MPPLRLLRTLALSCHPLPTAAVTAISAELAALAGLPLGRGALVVATVFTGQLSIGWSNDYVDAARDRRVKRAGKPAAANTNARKLVGVAAVVALTTTTALSVALGWPGGAVALVTVLSAWCYNLGLKSTVLSWLPYAVSFGLAPAVVTLSATPSRWPAGWLMAVGASLGVAAHFANVLPDFKDDAVTGIRGLPHRVGATVTATAVAALLVLTSAIILWGSGKTAAGWHGVVLAVAAIAGGLAASVARRNPHSRQFFAVMIVIVGLDLVALAVSGTRL